jgi:hypothetical protein
MKKQLIEVDIVKRNVYGSLVDPNDYKNSTVAEVIAWFGQVLQDVPAAYRASTRIEFETIPDYDSQYAQLRIYYEREETDEELEARRKSDIAHAEHRVAWAKQQAEQAAQRLALLSAKD